LLIRKDFFGQAVYSKKIIVSADDNSQKSALAANKFRLTHLNALTVETKIIKYK